MKTESLTIKEMFDYAVKGCMGLLVFMGIQIWQDTNETARVLPLIELRLAALEKFEADTIIVMREGRADRIEKQAELSQAIAVLNVKLVQLTEEFAKFRSTRAGLNLRFDREI